MIDSGTKKAAPSAGAREAHVEWAATELAQQYVDEAVLHYVNGQVYLSFGQIQIPASNPIEGSFSSVEILPVARVVFNEKSFHKILAMLNKVAPQILNSSAGDK